MFDFLPNHSHSFYGEQVFQLYSLIELHYRLERLREELQVHFLLALISFLFSCRLQFVLLLSHLVKTEQAIALIDLQSQVDGFLN